MLEDTSDRLREAGKVEIEKVNDEAWNLLNKSVPTRELWNLGFAWPLEATAAGVLPRPP